jgi:hypothetical protein
MSVLALSNLTLIPMVPAAPATEPVASDADKEAEYTKAIEKRTADILALLDINDPEKTKRVHDTIMGQYRALRDWHDANDAKLKKAMKGTSDEDKAQVQEITASRKALHDAYLAKLSADLTPEQVEKVKDKMTYGKVEFTYKGYLQAVPNMTDEEKAHVLDLLKEAREDAMDGGSAEEKTAVFNKYKGKINNYLAQRGKGTKPKKAPATAPAAEG